MTITIGLLSAVIPSLVLLWYFYSRDVYPEPPVVILVTFGWGILIVVPVVVLELTLFADRQMVMNPYLAGLSKGFWGAAFPEELLKFLVVVFYCSRHREFDDPMDGMVYGAVASLGFASMENLLYIASGGLTVAIARAVTAVPCHAFLGAIMGYYVGQARFYLQKRASLLFRGLVIAIFLHGLYDFPLMTLMSMNDLEMESSPTDNALMALGLTTVSVAVLLFNCLLAVRLIRRLRLDQLQVKARLDALIREQLFKGHL
jgi:RsiW-degrading membrane proteinase PrsW (M82 family)